MRRVLAILLVTACAQRPVPGGWNRYWIASPAEHRWHDRLAETERQAIYEAVLDGVPQIVGWRGRALTGLVLDARISASAWLTRSDEPPRPGFFEWHGAHSVAWLARLEDAGLVKAICRLDEPPGKCVADTPAVAVLLSVITPYGRAQEAVIVRIHAATRSGEGHAAAGWDVILTKDAGRWRVTYDTQNYHTYSW